MAEASPPPTENSARSAPRRSVATPVVGLTGEIGGGKSAVAALLADRGAVVIDADVAGHQALERPEVRRRLVARFGSTILAEEDDSRIDRRALGRIVFADPAALRDLEAVVHPVMVDRFRREIQEARARDDAPPLVAIDAAILLEAGWNALCDLVVFVDAPRTARSERVGRRGWSDAELQAREAAQWSRDLKMEHADYALPNAGDLDDLAAAVDQFIAWLSDHDLGARSGEAPRLRPPSSEPAPR